MRMAFTAAVAALVAAPAVAQASADPASWTGPYVGGRMGWSFQPGDGDEVQTFDTNRDGTFNDTVRTAAGANAFSPGFCGGRARGPTPATGCGKDHDSLEWAVHAGYDYDLGTVVVGVIGEAGIGYAEDSVSSFSTTPAYYTMTRRMKENASVRGRVGYALGADRKTLVYGTGGGVYAHMARDFRTSNTANSFTRYGKSNVWGWRAGAGVERKVDSHLVIGLQYLYTSLKDDDQRVAVGPGTAPLTNPFRIVNASGTDIGRSHSRFAAHNIGVTASYRF